MEPIILGIMALAIVLLIMQKLMAAQNTGIVVPDNAIYAGGGDPDIILMTATAAITPGDNVEPVSASTIKACDASAEEFLGTADLNKSNDSGGAGGNDVKTDFADGDVVPVITGACQVVKVAEGTVGVGKKLRPGTTAGTSVLTDTTSNGKYFIGRNLSGDTTDGNTLVMQQI